MHLKKFLLEGVRKIWKDKDERNLILQILMAFVVKGLSLVVSFFSMPLYIRFFSNDEVLGIWYTLLSMIAWINICDLGLGNGLRNRLTEALSVGDETKAKEYISSTYAALAVIIIPIILLVSILVQFADINTFFNIHHSLISPTVLKTSIILLLIGVAFSFVLRTINVIIYAIQKSALNNWLSLITSVLPLIYILVFPGGTMEENLISLTCVHVLAINLPLLLATLFLFRTKRLCAISPSLKYCSMSMAKNMLTLGVQFFLAQIFFMVLNSTNEIIITKIFSAADVVQYSIYNRLFTFVGSLFMLALSPLWSKVTKDLVQKKYRKIKITNRLLYAISGMAMLIEFAMVPLLQFIVKVWLGEEAIAINYTTGLIFALYGSVYILNVVLTTVANGMGNLKTQILFYGIFAVLKFPTIYLLAQYTDWNIVILYNAISLAVFCFFQFVWLERVVGKLIKDDP